MLLSAVSVLVVAQSSSEVPEGLLNNPVYIHISILSYNGMAPIKKKDHFAASNINLDVEWNSRDLVWDCPRTYPKD